MLEKLTLPVITVGCIKDEVMIFPVTIIGLPVMGVGSEGQGGVVVSPGFSYMILIK